MRLQKKITYSFLIPALLLLYSALQAQKEADLILQSFNEYSKNNLQEKLFVHTDKSFYVAGEIIWFKMYAADAYLNQPLDLSKISYVELLTKDHKPLLQAKIVMVEGKGSGSFQLPYSINSGNYIFRAYTNWMKNLGADFFFEKNISIVNALRKPDWPTTEGLKDYDVQFFAEGGNLVNGLESKLGFRIVDARGKSIDCSGVVVNNKNDTVAHFSTLRFGMGHFNLQPVTGEQYRGLIKTREGAVITKPIPVAITKGTVMRVNDIDQNSLRISIQSNTGVDSIWLLVHTRGLLKLGLSKVLVNGTAEIDIDKKQLGEGISHFTVFNASGQPICERLYFKKPTSLLSVGTKFDSVKYQTRKKVTVTLSTNDTKMQPVESYLSMSVYLLDSLQMLEEADIKTYLWLQSDIKGNIESPAYYFSSASDVEEVTDNLMLTQGWRRFRWDNLVSHKKQDVSYLPEIEGHLINGKIVDKRNGLPAENITTYLSVPGQAALFTGVTSTRDGSICFNVQNFYGGNEIIVQTAGLTDSRYRIDITSPFYEKYSDDFLQEFSLSEKQSSLLVSHSVQAQVGNTYSANKQQHFLYPALMDTLPFYGLPDKSYYLDDYTRFITLEEVMREYISDVRVRKNNNIFSYRVFNTPFKDFFETDPLVLIDGVPVFDINKMVAFDPLKIKRIDVVAQKFYQHNMMHEGIINYSTYQGDLAGYALDANALIVDYAGLQLQREFYSPVYETAIQVNSRIPDFRNQLYWSPDIHTDKKGNKQVSFYTADIPGTYGVVIQGITGNGLAGSMSTTLTVTK